ncbi:MAG: hypothetical protein HYY25_03435, partial [Candidatus Wallbacteria bacterium]|nr:hypothetical protein [Candidatus Wallbacteria bacterium]
ERDADDDKNGTTDPGSTDTNTNGVEDEFETIVTTDDKDGDGTPDATDPDIDGDGLLNSVDADADGNQTQDDGKVDTDTDGIVDDADVDSHPEASDPDGDGVISSFDTDDDGDGVGDTSDPDVDGDNIANDVDADDDGLFGTDSGVSDADFDQIVDSEDGDIDGDTLDNETDEDDDGDGIPDVEDADPIHSDQSGGGSGSDPTNGGGGSGSGGGTEPSTATIRLEPFLPAPVGAVWEYDAVQTVENDLGEHITYTGTLRIEVTGKSAETVSLSVTEQVTSPDPSTDQRTITIPANTHSLEAIVGLLGDCARAEKDIPDPMPLGTSVAVTVFTSDCATGLEEEKSEGTVTVTTGVTMSVPAGSFDDTVQLVGEGSLTEFADSTTESLQFTAVAARDVGIVSAVETESLGEGYTYKLRSFTVSSGGSSKARR